MLFSLFFPKMLSMIRFATAFSVVVVFTFLGCQLTQKTMIQSTGWTQAQYFQKAQEQVDSGFYGQAIAIYNLFEVRHPTDIKDIMAAEYEKSFILLLQGHRKLAQQQFQYLAAQYKGNPMRFLFSPGYSTLIQIVLDNLRSGDPRLYSTYAKVQEKIKKEKRLQKKLQGSTDDAAVFKADSKSADKSEK